MNQELEQLLKNRKVTAKAHRGEVVIHPQPQSQKESLIEDLFTRPVSRLLAFVFISLAAGSVAIASQHIVPETELITSLSNQTVLASFSNSRVLGASKDEPKEINAHLTVNGSEAGITVGKGEEVILSWSSENAHSCTITPLGNVPASGRGVYTLIESTRFVLECSSSGTSEFRVVEVNVES